MNPPDGYSHTVVAKSPMYCCLACGSVVHDCQTHDSWHRGLRDFITKTAAPYGPLKSSQQHFPLGLADS